MSARKHLCVEEIVEEIKIETEKKGEDPFLTPYYFDFIEHVRQAKEIVIVGAGNYGRDLYKILKQNGIHTVKHFADNGHERFKSGVYGKKVLSLADAVAQNTDAYFIITPQCYVMELIRQLVRLEVDIDRLDCFIAGNTGMIL